MSLTTAIENIAVHDPILHNLVAFQTHEIAFLAILDRNGTYRLHSNPGLIGKPAQGAIPITTIKDEVTTDERVTLRTGENAFQFNVPLYLPGETLAQRLTLHTYRADAIIPARQPYRNMSTAFRSE